MRSPRFAYSQLFYLTFLMLQAGLFATAPSASADPGEHQVKAAMVYNMIRFMDWPEDALLTTSPQFTICVAGKGGLGTAVDGLQGKQVKGKTVAVRQIASMNGAVGCQVIVLSDLDKSATTTFLDKTRSSTALTVSDLPGFARSGGIVGFILLNGKVRFEINQSAAQRHRIRVSAQLLKLAQIVQDGP